MTLDKSINTTMKKIALLILLFTQIYQFGIAQTAIHAYTKKTYMIPMRDGVKLFTILLLPAASSLPLPFLIQRTPYGADIPLPHDTLNVESMSSSSMYKDLLHDGYILVFQDMRGKFKSEGTFEMNRPLYHLINKNKTDESTDAYDAIDWLIKNIQNNNGKAGNFGVSYLGYTALDAISDPHPALKASSPRHRLLICFWETIFITTGLFLQSLEKIDKLGYNDSWMRYLNGEALISVTPIELEATLVFKIVIRKTIIFSLDLHFYDEVYEHLTLPDDFEQYISKYDRRLQAAVENRFKVNRI